MAASLVGLATVALFGIIPAVRASRVDLLHALKSEALAEPGRRLSMRQWLVVAQVSLSMVLLAGAAVLGRSYSNTRSADLGFGRKELLLAWIPIRPAVQGGGPLETQAVAQLKSLPGVVEVAAAIRAPLSLSSGGMFRLVTFPDNPDAVPAEVKYNAVSSTYFSAMGIPVLQGRVFGEADQQPGQPVVLVSQSFAAKYLPGEDALGKTVLVNRKPHVVIGVVRDAPVNQIGELTAAQPYMYLPLGLEQGGEFTLIIQVQGKAAELAPSVRHALRSLNRTLDPSTLVTMEQLIGYSARLYRMTAALAALLGIIGLMLTAVGLYGVVSYGVSRRTREIGIRVALGAATRDTVSLVLGDVVKMGLLGAAIGVPAAFLTTRLLASILFGVSPWDVVSFAAALLLLAAVLLVAGWFPTRRALRLHPAAALRES